MATAKDILLGNKELAGWWNSIAHDPRFDQVVSLAFSEFFETSESPEQNRGAKAMVSMLRSFAENQPDGTAMPKPGLTHNPKKLEPAK